MLRKETVEPSTLGLLNRLVLLPELKSYRLVGGTALSLLYGHRKSIDLDFFTDKPIEKDILIEALQENFGNIVTLNDRTKLIYQCVIQNVKVDFVSVRDPFLYPTQIIENIPFVDIRDLIALKLNAIKGRGVKKDFWDIALLLQHYSIGDLYQFYLDRYPYDDSLAVIRSLGYFDDAENIVDPDSLDGMTWKDVKKIVGEALAKYYREKSKN